MDHRPWFASLSPRRPQDARARIPEKSVFSILARVGRAVPGPPGDRVVRQAHLVRAADGRGRAVLGRPRPRWASSKGDRVGLLLPNCPQYVIGYYATVRLGAVIVGNNPLYTERELAHQLTDAGIEVLVTLDQLYDKVAAVREQVGLKEVVVTGPRGLHAVPEEPPGARRWCSRRRRRREGRPWPPVPKDAPVKRWKDLMKSAGDAAAGRRGRRQERPGRPDLHRRHHRALQGRDALARQPGVQRACRARPGSPTSKDGEEGVMCVLPFFHSYGMTVCMNIGLLKAGKLVLLPAVRARYDPQGDPEGEAHAVPGRAADLHRDQRVARSRRSTTCRSIRACLSGAAPLPIAVAEKFEQVTGARGGRGLRPDRDQPDHPRQPDLRQAQAGHRSGCRSPTPTCKICDIDDPDKEHADRASRASSRWPVPRS